MSSRPEDRITAARIELLRELRYKLGDDAAKTAVAAIGEMIRASIELHLEAFRAGLETCEQCSGKRYVGGVPCSACNAMGESPAPAMVPAPDASILKAFARSPRRMCSCTGKTGCLEVEGRVCQLTARAEMNR